MSPNNPFISSNSGLLNIRNPSQLIAPPGKNAKECFLNNFKGATKENLRMLIADQDDNLKKIYEALHPTLEDRINSTKQNSYASS